ncbi:MAG: methyl-accepting chemotaxis protein [Gallionella sp.]
MFATIRAKLIALSMLSLLLIVIGGGAGYYGKLEFDLVVNGNQGHFEIFKANAQVKSRINEIRADVLQVVYEAKNGETEAYIEAVSNLSTRINSLGGGISKILRSTTISEGTRKSASNVNGEYKRYAGYAQDIATMALVDELGANSILMQFVDSYQNISSDHQLLSNQINQEVEQAKQKANYISSVAEMVIFATVGATCILLVLFSFLTYRGINGPIERLRLAVAIAESDQYRSRVNLDSWDEAGILSRSFDKLIDVHMATLSAAAAEKERLNNSVIGLFTAMGALAQKDLTIRAPVTDDIIGTLGDAINQLTDVTATVLHHVTKVAGVVEAASERMKTQSDVVNDMAKEEDVIVVRLISNLETAMASIGEVAIFARDSNRAAAEATTSTESAMQTVQATLSGMNAIRETISEMEKRIKRLGERSQEISQIVNLINTISERTHVLSLNAAMQAAMAGEAGRGFAVVAEEVQRLAENSRQATGQIANLVQNIQVETNDTIATVNKTIEQVVKESELAHNAGERMRETHESTARLVRLVATISTSSTEQTKIASVLRSAADEIAQFTDKTSEQLVAQNQSAASLVSASRKLVDAISVFKLPQEDQPDTLPEENGSGGIDQYEQLN